MGPTYSILGQYKENCGTEKLLTEINKRAESHIKSTLGFDG